MQTRMLLSFASPNFYIKNKLKNRTCKTRHVKRVGYSNLHVNNFKVARSHDKDNLGPFQKLLVLYRLPEEYPGHFQGQYDFKLSIFVILLMVFTTNQHSNTINRPQV